MRRPQKSELMRSASCQSGPVSSTTTFLPALASVAANTEPEAPAPTMTTSTFSRVAMSPPLQRRDMRLVWNAERFVALDRAVHHVDRIAAHHEVGETLSRSLPSLQLALSHEVHHFALRRYGQPGKALIGLRRGATCGLSSMRASSPGIRLVLGPYAAARDSTSQTAHSIRRFH